MVESIAYDKRKITPVCAYLDGEYGVDGLFVGVPVILGKQWHRENPRDRPDRRGEGRPGRLGGGRAQDLRRGGQGQPVGAAPPGSRGPRQIGGGLFSRPEPSIPAPPLRGTARVVAKTGFLFIEPRPKPVTIMVLDPSFDPSPPEALMRCHPPHLGLALLLALVAAGPPPADYSLVRISLRRPGRRRLPRRPPRARRRQVKPGIGAEIVATPGDHGRPAQERPAPRDRPQGPRGHYAAKDPTRTRTSVAGTPTARTSPTSTACAPSTRR